MNSLPENFATNQQRLEEAKTERYRALQKIRTLCETGRRSLVVPFLMVNLQRNPALKKIRLWQLDAIMFDVSKYIAVKTIRRMRETIGDQSTVKDGYADLGWALADKDATVRMTISTVGKREADQVRLAGRIPLGHALLHRTGNRRTIELTGGHRI